MKIISSLVALLFSQSSISCPALIGTWKSSKEMSMDYNIQLTNIQQKQIDFLSQILGHLLITYTENEIIEHEVAAIKVKVNSKESDFIFKKTISKYTITSCSENTIKLRYKHPYAGKVKTSVTFIDDNTFWISNNLPNVTMREYFTRVSK